MGQALVEDIAVVVEAGGEAGRKLSIPQFKELLKNKPMRNRLKMLIDIPDSSSLLQWQSIFRDFITTIAVARLK